jgi:glutamine synthetase
MAALLQEKPFNNVNGSGKHNNWSIATVDGVGLLNVDQISKDSGSSEIFPVIMSALVSAIDTHGDLMRMSIACPGNDFRLGACEAPPAIISTYLGDDMTTYLDGYRKGSDAPYKPNLRDVDLGIACIPPLTMPAEDRNRTSPFPYSGHRFEFRAVGSSQNVSIVNTVLATISAEAFKNFADAIESGKKPRDVASAALNKHWKVVFNGNNYDEANQDMLTKTGVWRIDAGVDAICRYTEPKNVKLFQAMNVLQPEECEARQTIMLDHYIGTVEIEALAMVDMITQHIIPSCNKTGIGLVKELEAAVKILEKAVKDIHAAGDGKVKAKLARTLRLETMVKLRETCDAAEALVPAEHWTLATYKELLFLDQTTA